MPSSEMIDNHRPSGEYVMPDRLSVCSRVIFMCELA